MSVGTVVALSILLTRLLGPLQALSNVRIDIMTALVSFDRVFEVLDLPNAITEKPGAAALPAGASGVEFVDVYFGYPARWLSGLGVGVGSVAGCWSEPAGPGVG